MNYHNLVAIDMMIRDHQRRIAGDRWTRPGLNPLDALNRGRVDDPESRAIAAQGGWQLGRLARRILLAGA